MLSKTDNLVSLFSKNIVNHTKKEISKQLKRQTAIAQGAYIKNGWKRAFTPAEKAIYDVDAQTDPDPEDDIADSTNFVDKVLNKKIRSLEAEDGGRRFT